MRDKKSDGMTKDKSHSPFQCKFLGANHTISITCLSTCIVHVLADWLLFVVVFVVVCYPCDYKKKQFGEWGLLFCNFMKTDLGTLIKAHPERCVDYVTSQRWISMEDFMSIQIYVNRLSSLWESFMQRGNLLLAILDFPNSLTRICWHRKMSYCTFFDQYNLCPSSISAIHGLPYFFWRKK